RPDSLAPQRWAPISSSGRRDAPGTRSASLASFSATRTLSSAKALTRASTSRRRRCRSWRSPRGADAIGARPPPSALVSAADPSPPTPAVPVKASTSVSTLPVPFLRAASTALQLQASTVARRSPLNADQRRPELRRLNALDERFGHRLHAMMVAHHWCVDARDCVEDVHLFGERAQLGEGLDQRAGPRPPTRPQVGQPASPARRQGPARARPRSPARPGRQWLSGDRELIDYSGARRSGVAAVDDVAQPCRSARPSRRRGDGGASRSV